MNTNELEKWGQTRQIGKGKYIMRYGILYWGFPIALLTVFFNISREKGVAGVFTYENIMLWVLTSLIYGAIIGWIFGLFLWARMEKLWKNHKG